MTPDRAEDAAAVSAEYRARYAAAPHRVSYLDAVATAGLLFQEIWKPEQSEIDFGCLCQPTSPAILLFDDAAGYGATGWAASRDARAWARAAVIISPPAIPAEATAGVIYAVLAAGSIARTVVVEAPASAMQSWSRFMGERQIPVWLIADVEPVLVVGVRH